jgi:NodT family efflux transporter outer membrane factor (OMF) lipoprotein
MMNTRLIQTVLLVAVLSACSVGPDFKKPEMVTPTSFTRNGQMDTSPSTSQSPKGVDAQWWKAYGSDEINQLVDLALKNNPNIESASANLRVAQANVRAQQGLFFPSISAGYGVSRQKTGPILQPSINPPADGVVDSIYNLHTAGFTVGFAPDIWGGNRRQVESLKALGNAQSYQLAALQTTIANNVVATAIQEASLREQVKAVRDLAQASREQLEHARRLRAAGYSSSVDLAVQESLFAQATAQVPTLEKSREQSLNLLAVLCGKMPNEQLLLPSIDKIRFPSPLPNVVPSAFVEQRPDVKIAEEYVRAANAQIGVAIANLLPQISLTGNIGSVATLFGDLSNSANSAWALAGGISQPIFQGGTLFARKRAAEAGIDSAIGQYKSTVLGAFQNVADTLYAIDADGKYYKTALDNEKANQQIFEQSDRQVKAGYLSEAGMLLTKQTYLQARINSLQAYATYLGDTTALYQALGGGWSQKDSEIYSQK